MILLLLTLTAHGQDLDGEPCVSCNDIEALEHRVDHQIDQVDSLIDRLNRVSEDQIDGGTDPEDSDTDTDPEARPGPMPPEPEIDDTDDGGEP